MPLVFLDGDPEKVDRIRTLLPDAIYTSWTRVRSALKQALARPVSDPVRPTSVLAGYSGTPLPKKLGVKEGHVVRLMDAPIDFERTLGALPAGAILQRDGRAAFDLEIWFVRSKKALEGRMSRIASGVADRKLWIVWPKKTSSLASDLGEADVRKTGLAAGLVDYKVCAVDATWSGLLFTRHKHKRGVSGIPWNRIDDVSASR